MSKKLANIQSQHPPSPWDRGMGVRRIQDSFREASCPLMIWLVAGLGYLEIRLKKVFRIEIVDMLHGFLSSVR